MTDRDGLPFRRTITLDTAQQPDGSSLHRAALDDPLHGFAVELWARDGQIVAADALAPRHPWTTCPGALASVCALRGPLTDAAAAMVRAPRDTTCVHLNDLVRLAAAGHRSRHYEIVVTPGSLTATRDGEVVVAGDLVDWILLASPSPAGLRIGDAGWDALDRSVGESGDELGRIVRRALSVAMGYFLLPWAEVRVASEVAWDVMANSCHTFSDARVGTAGCLVDRSRS